MAPPANDDWSDSDDEIASEVKTSVLLGVPDGVVDDALDLNDAAVSRIGGHPVRIYSYALVLLGSFLIPLMCFNQKAFLPSREPPLSSSQCKVCSNPSELLVQLWCPFEDSSMDRALYIWGCARAACQGKDGSVRAWRGLRYNEKYAAKLKKKLVKKRAAEKAKAETLAAAEQTKREVKSNPFATEIASQPTMFGLGAQIFGQSAASPPSAPARPSSPSIDAAAGLPEAHVDNEDRDLSDAESESSASEVSLLTAMASANLADSPWKATPSYTPLYLSTVSEYLPPPRKSKVPSGAKITDPQEGRKGDKDSAWAPETYENSLELDHVFERFLKRVGYEGEQCIRYELGGVPLPYSSDKVFERLFPSPPEAPLPVTKSAFTVTPTPRRTYDPTSIPPCPACQSKRIFECQLMPNLINTIRQHAKDGGEDERLMTDEERRKAVERVLKGPGADGDGRGIDWGTCLIFSCEKDCHLTSGGAEAKECWWEEFVLIQAAI